jgi:uncharacterized protein (TIGR03066 family)
MNALRLLAVGATVCLGVAAARADDKADNAKLLVGKWEVTRADPGTVPVGGVIEFTKDGKLKVAFKRDGKDETRGGTYTVEKDTINLVTKRDDQERKQEITITKISDKVMSLKGQDGKTLDLKKK